MKKHNIFSILILVNFLLTIIFMLLQNLFCLVTFGLAILCTLGVNEINSDKNYINKLKKEYGSFQVGNIQIKLLKIKNVFSNIIFITSGISLILGYIYYLLIKYKILSMEITFGLLIPFNIIIFPIIIGIHFLLLGVIKQNNIKKYNTKVFAECIKVDESIEYMDHGNGFDSRIEQYIVVFKYNYNNKEYIVSNIEPLYYKNIPIQGRGYYIYIDKDNPEDFVDNLNDFKNNFIDGIIMLLISLILIITIIYIWIK